MTHYESADFCFCQNAAQVDVDGVPGFEFLPKTTKIKKQKSEQNRKLRVAFNLPPQIILSAYEHARTVISYCNSKKDRCGLGRGK